MLKEAATRTSSGALVGSVTLISLFCFCTAAADDKPFQGPDPKTEKVIRYSLHKLHETYRIRNFGFKDDLQTKGDVSKLRGLGFDSIDQLAKVTIGQGFPLYTVHL